MAGRSTLQIDLASPVPAYRQIANDLRTMLVDGTLAPGTQLPTVRRLAIDPAVFVPKRFGIGYTLNLANPWAWLAGVLLFTGWVGILFVALTLY